MMKRIVLSLFGAALLVMVTACDSGGGGAGLPADKSEPVPVNLPKADMREQKIDLKKIKPQGPDPSPAPTPEKKD
jgi:hypothetical protein